MLSKEQDIEALARQSKEIDRRKDPHAETDILPSNAAIATTPNESSSVSHDLVSCLSMLF
jgi:hypothetical protein